MAGSIVFFFKIFILGWINLFVSIFLCCNLILIEIDI